MKTPRKRTNPGAKALATCIDAIGALGKVEQSAVMRALSAYIGPLCEVEIVPFPIQKAAPLQAPITEIPE